jgi:Flp pilus assembly pilin Flp
MNFRPIRSRLSESGQTVAEYALIVSAIAVAALSAYEGFAGHVSSLVSAATSLLH